MKENSLKSNHVQDSHRLLVIATLIIFVLANIISLYLYLSGKGSTQLSLRLIGLEMLVISSTLAVTAAIIKYFPNRNWVKYLTVTMFGICILSFDYVMSGAPEVFANFYLVMGISLIYLDMSVSLYAIILSLGLHTLLVMTVPDIVYSQNFVLSMAVRYASFIFLTIRPRRTNQPIKSTTAYPVCL
jgi:hypothetical protein